MAKTISSAGLQEFLETGKPTKVYPVEAKGNGAAAAVTIEDEPSKAATAAASQEAVPAAASGDVTPPIEPKVTEPEEGFEAEDNELPERARKRIGKKHYEMKKAQEEAAESERFAEQLFNEREEFRKKLETTERERDELKTRVAVPAPEVKEPDPQDAKYTVNGQFMAIDYAKDLAAYSAKKAVADDRKATNEAQARAVAERAAAEFTARLERARETKYKDYDEVIRATNVRLPNEALTYISQSEYGPDLAYFLAQSKNREVADRITAMHPIRAIAELGKLETTFEKPANAAPEKTNGATSQAASQAVGREGAPAPITPLSTSGATTIKVDPAKMNFRELRAYERQRAAEKRRR